MAAQMSVVAAGQESRWLQPCGKRTELRSGGAGGRPCEVPPGCWKQHRASR